MALTPQQCAATVDLVKRRRLAQAMGHVEAGRQEVMAMKSLLTTLQRRLDAMLVDLTYDVRLLDEAIRLLDETPTQTLPKLGRH